MTRRGRPLRFLAATLGGWALLRTGMLWPTLEAARDLVDGLATPTAIAAVVPADASLIPGRPVAVGTVFRSSAATPARVAGAPPRPRKLTHIALGAASFLSFGRATPVEDEQPEGAVPPPLRPTPINPTKRLTGSAWGILREGVGTGFPGGQLGGSQAGVRVAYGLGARQRAALTARLSAPLEGRGAEAAFGVELRPAFVPIRAIAERRISLDGARGATALYAVGGVDPTPIAAGFRLEAYAQGGVVIRGEAQGFADGAARVTRRVSRAIDLGVGAWGGTQSGVSRVDVGPTVGVALPVARRAVRLSIDWRQRVAGRARPGSGPALSIGSDF